MPPWLCPETKSFFAPFARNASSARVSSPTPASRLTSYCRALDQGISRLATWKPSFSSASASLPTSLVGAPDLPCMTTTPISVASAAGETGESRSSAKPRHGASSAENMSFMAAPLDGTAYGQGGRRPNILSPTMGPTQRRGKNRRAASADFLRIYSRLGRAAEHEGAIDPGQLPGGTQLIARRQPGLRRRPRGALGMEALHELARTFVIHRPQAGEHGVGTAEEKGCAAGQGSRLRLPPCRCRFRRRKAPPAGHAGARQTGARRKSARRPRGKSRNAAAGGRRKCRGWRSGSHRCRPPIAWRRPVSVAAGPISSSVR
jgi:hypothetical protein